MIIATAGHVDHGKTALIKQLSGVETDRLKEERRRGLSINLGYAYLDTGGDTPIGFIDVPGHERFINTMISGVTGIDLGLLVIAADDGPMPQTLEHLDVLTLLGVANLVLVITKIDRVEAEELAIVTQRCLALLPKSLAEKTPVFHVNNLDGHGIERLSQHLREQQDQQQRIAQRGCFRLAVDRAFTLKGAGLIVTGTANTGVVNAGDTIVLHPAGKSARVRTIRVNDRPTSSTRGNMRCALNLSGDISLADVSAGHWVLDENAGEATTRVDARVQLLDRAPFPLKHLTPVKIHLGATRLAAKMALLERDDHASRLSPGESAFVQLQLEDPLPCHTGQRFIVRDIAETCVLGGGSVVEPIGIRRRQTHRTRINYLNAMAHANHQDALHALIALETDIDMSAFAKARNLTPEEGQQLKVEDTHRYTSEGNDYLVANSRWQKRLTEITQTVEQWHHQYPEEAGINVGKLHGLLGKEGTKQGRNAAIVALVTQKILALRDGKLRCTHFKPTQAAVETSHWSTYYAHLQSQGRHLPLFTEVEVATGINQRELIACATQALKDRIAYRVSERRLALSETLLVLAEELLELAVSNESLTVVELKAHWKMGRSLTIEVLEFFDSIRFTQRRGNIRVVLDREQPSRLFSLPHPDPSVQG